MMSERVRQYGYSLGRWMLTDDRCSTAVSVASILSSFFAEITWPESVSLFVLALATSTGRLIPTQSAHTRVYILAKDAGRWAVLEHPLLRSHLFDHCLLDHQRQHQSSTSAFVVVIVMADRPAFSLDEQYEISAS